jgi:hypothetical protein
VPGRDHRAGASGRMERNRRDQPPAGELSPFPRTTPSALIEGCR